MGGENRKTKQTSHQTFPEGRTTPLNQTNGQSQHHSFLPAQGAQQVRNPFDLNKNSGIFNTILFCVLFFVLPFGLSVLWDINKEFIYKKIIGEKELLTIILYSPLIIFYGYFCYTIKNTMDEKTANKTILVFGFILSNVLAVLSFLI